LGEVTGDLRFILHDAVNDTTPVDIDLAVLLGEIPQKTFEDKRISPETLAVHLPAGLTIISALKDVLPLYSER
jgi:phosphoribosylformylglycinamidine synthase